MKMIFNTRERALSTDHNRLQQFASKDVAEHFRYMANVRRLGTGVTINVSNGKSPQVAVPNVVGSTQPTATAALKAAGFAVTAKTQVVVDPSKDGIVLSQNPPGGSNANKGSTVTIVVGHFKAPAPPHTTTTTPTTPTTPHTSTTTPKP